MSKSKRWNESVMSLCVINFEDYIDRAITTWYNTTNSCLLHALELLGLSTWISPMAMLPVNCCSWQLDVYRTPYRLYFRDKGTR
jgi:hypothetical protein